MNHPSNTSSINLIRSAERRCGSVAIVTPESTHTYGELLETSGKIASALLASLPDLNEQRIAFPAAPGFEYAATQWGIWRAGGIAVPLPLEYPTPELEYILHDAKVSTIIANSDELKILEPIVHANSIEITEIANTLVAPLKRLPEIDADRRAMILYTSGTTGKTKGVVTTHRNVEAQCEMLIKAWEWSASDRILHVLPLHHVHGIVNILTCALKSGAACEFLPRFDAESVWDRFIEGGITLFMAVPTIYAKLIAAWEGASPKRQFQMSQACASIRLMVSGSASLPIAIFEKWASISGHRLLERYGMTEIGMALSNPLHGERIPGHVGTPLPGVQIQCADENGRRVPSGASGEIEVRGPAVFKEYWKRPDATRSAFRKDWFRTGDVAVIENSCYKILGRKDVDIIKTGGYKVSALEIEETLREHAAIEDCAAVGVDDSEWGEVVSVGVTLRGQKEMNYESLRRWAKDRLAFYKVPKQMLVLEELPRNSMGKVQKQTLVRLFHRISGLESKTTKSRSSY